MKSFTFRYLFQENGDVFAVVSLLGDITVSASSKFRKQLYYAASFVNQINGDFANDEKAIS